METRAGAGEPSSVAPGLLDVDDAPARLALAVGRLNRLLRPTRPTLSHGLLSALSTVVGQGPLRPGELARIEGVAAPTATRAVVELESRGLVTRASDPDDGRSFLVDGTPAGREAILEARRERAANARALLSHLGEDDRARVIGALSALEAAAGLLAP
jgi:DNA-binding MarR family transcriptional regulator